MFKRQFVRISGRDGKVVSIWLDLLAEHVQAQIAEFGERANNPHFRPVTFPAPSGRYKSYRLLTNPAIGPVRALVTRSGPVPLLGRKSEHLDLPPLVYPTTSTRDSYLTPYFSAITLAVDYGFDHEKAATLVRRLSLVVDGWDKFCKRELSIDVSDADHVAALRSLRDERRGFLNVIGTVEDQLHNRVEDSLIAAINGVDETLRGVAMFETSLPNRLLELRSTRDLSRGTIDNLIAQWDRERNTRPGWQHEPVTIEMRPSGSPDQDRERSDSSDEAESEVGPLDPIAEVAATWIRLSRWLRTFAREEGLNADELTDAEVIQLLHREGLITKQVQTNLHALRYERVEVEHNGHTPSREDAISFANRATRIIGQMSNMQGESR